jgi:PAS domain S-box-containing protein
VAETGKSEEQKAAEAEVDRFRKDLGPFVVAAETTRMAMLFTDAKEVGNPIIFANEAFLKLTGFQREEVLGHRFDDMMARGADEEALSRVAAAFQKTSNEDLKIRYCRENGKPFWTDLFISPVNDAEGRVVQHFISFVDLTTHVEDRAHCEKMVDELNHRVKNTLATVQSIVAQALRSSPDLVSARRSIEDRIQALSQSHDLLTQENWEGADLRDVLAQTLRPFGVRDGAAERFTLDGPHVFLSTKAALALGIAFHELATNALKYGAFSNETGAALISWKVETGADGDRLRVRWEERGGPVVVAPTRRGFGTEVIERGLGYELSGSAHLAYPSTGVICTIDVAALEAVRER